MSPVLRAGFVPLVDAAPLIVATEMGLARRHGFTLELIKQPSWASLRDHLNLGHLDCAQALAPMPIAAALGIGQVQARLAVPFVLSRGGNAITLSRALVDEVRVANGGAKPENAGAWARALAIAIRQRRNPVTLATVYPFSGHNFELRYWLATAGIHPDRDVRLIGIPPALMVESLRARQIDGFCVGAPWASMAAAEGVGTIVATKTEIFPHGIEKVLAVPESALDDVTMIAALLRALAEAAEWCDSGDNREELANLLARPEFLGTDAAYSLEALDGRLSAGGSKPDSDYLYFSRLDANRPRRQDALWLYAQMLRWGQIPASRESEAVAASVYRPDVYAYVFGSKFDESVSITACDRIDFDGRSVSSYLQMFSLSTPFESSQRDL